MPLASHLRARRSSRRRSLVVPLAALLVLALTSVGCLTSQGVGPNADVPLETVDEVDLERFSGAWYVIENIGLSAEEGAHRRTRAGEVTRVPGPA